MASDAPRAGGTTESCGNCGGETPHTVTVELRTESTPDGDAAFIRRPYRVSTCRECGVAAARPIDDD